MTLVPEQIFVCDAVTLTAGVRTGFITMLMELEIATAGEKQFKEDIISQITILPSASDDVEKEEVPVTCDTPFTFQLKPGLLPPFTGLAIKVILVPLQTLLVSAVMKTEAFKLLTTFMTMVLETTVVVLVQVKEEVSSHITTSPFANAALVYVELFVPTLKPFRFHWYAGAAPPLVGVAVKVTPVPEQMVLPVLALIVTDGVTVPVTVIVMLLDVAVVGKAQLALEVSKQVTTSLFESELLL